jgi:hypothetical protein
VEGSEHDTTIGPYIQPYTIRFRIVNFAPHSTAYIISPNITMQLLACIFVFCPLVSALAFNTPEVTSVAEIVKFRPQGWSPQPTEPPQFNKELLKRQSSSLTLIEGPDAVCGYQFGDAGMFHICRQLTTLTVFLRCRLGIVRVDIHLWICYSVGSGRRSRLL